MNILEHKPSTSRKLLSWLVWIGLTGVVFPLAAAEAPAKATDDAWQSLVAAKDAFYEMQPPSLEPKAFKAFLSTYSQKAGELADRYDAYRKGHSDSSHAREAWDDWMDFLGIAAHGHPKRMAELEQAEADGLKDPALTRRQRESIRNNQIDRTTDAAERERMVRAFQGEAASPHDFFCFHILQIAEWSDLPRSRDLVEEVLRVTDNQPTLANYRGEALHLKTRLDRVGHPLQLAFTALDGREVALEHYRGKVVLLDFWATWCPPCVGGIPRVKSLWNDVHKEGFEVIGISYDTERQDLERFVKKNELQWPQFFDAQGSGAAVVQKLGGPGPPSYWLIDQHGVLVDVNASSEMERKVKRLLGLKKERSSEESKGSVNP